MHPKRTARRLLPWAIVLTVGLLATVTTVAVSRTKEPPKRNLLRRRSSRCQAYP